MEEGNDGSLELRPSPRVHRCRREGFPNDCLADVCRYEERDARAQTIAFLKTVSQRFE